MSEPQKQIIQQLEFVSNLQKSSEFSKFRLSLALTEQEMLSILNIEKERESNFSDKIVISMLLEEVRHQKKVIESTMKDKTFFSISDILGYLKTSFTKTLENLSLLERFLKIILEAQLNQERLEVFSMDVAVSLQDLENKEVKTSNQYMKTALMLPMLSLKLFSMVVNAYTDSIKNTVEPFQTM